MIDINTQSLLFWGNYEVIDIFFNICLIPNSFFYSLIIIIFLCLYELGFFFLFFELRSSCRLKFSHITDQPHGNFFLKYKPIKMYVSEIICRECIICFQHAKVDIVLLGSADSGTY